LWECGLQDSVHADIYDGDTPANERQRIRQKCQIIFTNPDMLHAAILPNHTSWLAFLKHLRFIVVDEIHVYSGTFGSNFAFVIRRLQRLLAGISPRQEDGLQWILCSATVSNPTEHSRQLFNLPAVEEDSLLTISSDGSPRQTKDFLVWRTDSLLADSARLLIWLAECRMKTIAFCCTRKTCELLMNEVTQQLAASHTGDHLIDRIKSYRGGYRVELRR
jgi:DEAD/DEAH box helicase domain-containing protein